jgi:periplasmic mercuric ion binding protein
MKKLSVFLFVFFISLGAMAKGEKEVKIKTSAICEMCKERVEKNLTLSKGVKEAILDLETKVVTIKYNDKKTNTDNLKKVILTTGYDADEVLAGEKNYNKLPSCCKKDSEMAHQ